MKKKKSLRFKSHNLNRLLLPIAFCLLFITGYAQQKNVTGIVLDSTGQPLSAVSVTIKGNQAKGTTTNAKGVFNISAAINDILVFSSVGYDSREEKVNGSGAIKVMLTSNAAGMNEVVVIGYGTVRKRDLTGAVASIKGSDIKSQGVSDLTRSLQGRLPGVTIESSGGDPGSGTRILIRGVGTLGTDASPLYIVDGVQVLNINNIPSQDIESFDVLKDASAAAIYGSRAANGVVLITTKTGKNGRPVVQFAVNLGRQKLDKKIDVLNAEQWATVSNAAHAGTNVPPLDIAKNPSSLGAGTDWQDAIYRKALTQQYNLIVSGGNDYSNYSVSGGYNNQQGIVDVTGYTRYNFRVKSETTKGRFKFGETVLMSKEKWIKMPGGWGGQGGNPVGSAAKMIPVFQIYDSTALGGYAGAYGPVVNVANPVAQLHLEDINRQVSSTMINAFGQFNIIKGLSYKLNFGYTNVAGSDYDYERKFTVGTLFAHPTNDLSIGRDLTTLLLVENTLNYNTEFGKHRLQALAGYTYQEKNYNITTAARTDLPDGITNIDAGAGTASNGGNSLKSALESILGRVIYSYDNRYLLTASFRRDGSSRFGSANRFGNFPSIAVGWNISNEKFFTSLSGAISTLKLRASYGVLGNQEIPDYLYSAAISSNINYVVGQDQSKWFGAIQTAFASPNIKWESTKTSDVGLDLGLFQNKLSVTADYFSKETSDLLLQVPIPGSAGSSSFPYINGGSVRNSGFELGLNYGNRAGRINYNVFGTLSAIKNKVLEMGTGTQQIFGGQPTHHGASTTVTQAGGSVSSFFLLKDEGIFNTQEEVNAYAKDGKLIQPNAKPGDIKFLDANGDGQINNKDLVNMGSPFPKFEYGFGFNANGYNFDIAVFFQGTSGNKIYNGLRQDLESMSLEFNYSTSTLNAWTPTNHSNIPRAVIDDPNSNDRSSSRFLENGSYLRMKTLQIGYNFSQGLITQMHMTSFRAYLSADNLFTITNYSGNNPDIGRTGSIFDRGVDFGHVSYPLAKTVSIGVQISL